MGCTVCVESRAEVSWRENLKIKWELLRAYEVFDGVLTIILVNELPMMDGEGVLNILVREGSYPMGVPISCGWLVRIGNTIISVPLKYLERYA